MCQGIAILESEVPIELIERQRLFAYRYKRENVLEFQFLMKHRTPMLPVWHEGSLKLYQWGNNERRSPLPQTAWTWKETIEEGKWSCFEPEPVNIPCNYGLEKVWYLIEEGIRGLLIHRPQRSPVVYMICEPSTRYYQNMTHSMRMPVLIDQVI